MKQYKEHIFGIGETIDFRDVAKLISILYKNAPKLSSSELKEVIRLNGLLLNAIFDSNQDLKFMIENKLMSILRAHQLEDAYRVDNPIEVSILDSQATLMAVDCARIGNFEGQEEVATEYFNYVKVYFNTYNLFAQDYYKYDSTTVFHIRRLLKDYRMLIHSKIIRELNKLRPIFLTYDAYDHRIDVEIEIKVNEILNLIGMDEGYNPEADNLINKTLSLLNKLDKHSKDFEDTRAMKQVVNSKLSDILLEIYNYNISTLEWAVSLGTDIEELKEQLDEYFKEKEYPHQEYYKYVTDTLDNNLLANRETHFKIALANQIKESYRLQQ